MTTHWRRRRPPGVPRAGGPPQPVDGIDAWLDALHGLATARRAERVMLARAGHALRIRLGQRPR